MSSITASNLDADKLEPSSEKDYEKEERFIMTNSSSNLCEITHNNSRSYSVDMDYSRSIFDTSDNAKMIGTVDGESGISNEISETAKRPPSNISKSPDVWLLNRQSESSFCEINQVTEENKNEVSADLVNMSDKHQIKSPNKFLHTWLKRDFNLEYLKSRLKPAVQRKIQYEGNRGSRIVRGIRVDAIKMRERGELGKSNVIFNNFRNGISPRNLGNTSSFIPSKALMNVDSPPSDSMEKSETDNFHTRTENRDLASGDACHTFEEKMDSSSSVMYNNFRNDISPRILENASTFIPFEALINVDNPSPDSLEKSKTDNVHTKTENRDLASGDVCHRFEEKMDSSSSVIYRNFGNDISQRVLENAGAFIPSEAVFNVDNPSPDSLEKSKTGNVFTREDRDLALGDAGRPLEEKINGYFRRGESEEITEMMMPAFKKTREIKNDVSLQLSYSNVKMFSESDTKKNIISESSYTHPQNGSTFNDSIPLRKYDPSSNQPFFNKSMGNNKELKGDSGEGFFSQPERYSEVLTQEKSSQPLPLNSNSSLEKGDTPLNAANEIKVEHHMEAPSNTDDNILSEREVHQGTQTGLEILENNARDSNSEVKKEEVDNEIKVEYSIEASSTVENNMLSEIGLQQDIPTGLPAIENEARESKLEVTNEGDANEIDEYHMEASSTVENNMSSEIGLQQDIPTGLPAIESEARESKLEVTNEGDANEIGEYHMETSSPIEDNILSEAEMQQDTPTGFEIIGNDERESNLEVTNEAYTNEMEVEYHKEASLRVEDDLMEVEMEQDTPTELQNVDNKAKVANVAPQQVTSHIDKDVSKIILLALKSKNFVNGGTMTDLAKHLKKELNHRTSSNLKQELQAFLNHAVSVNTLELRKKRYFLTAVSNQKKGKSKR